MWSASWTDFDEVSKENVDGEGDMCSPTVSGTSSVAPAGLGKALAAALAE